VKSCAESGSGKCEDDTPVTWYEGKFSTLFVPYGIKTFKIGYDKSERPVCVEVRATRVIRDVEFSTPTRWASI
jgi:hypothetical protein